MIRLRSLAHLLAVVAVLAWPAATAAASNGWAAFSDVVGAYQGVVWSGGDVVPVTTRFHFGAHGALEGSYTFLDQGQPSDGTLTHARIEGDRFVVFIWHDKDGYGVLEVTFAKDGSSFEGAWATLDDTPNAAPWIGEKEH